jgi:hypothetical protein
VFEIDKHTDIFLDAETSNKADYEGAAAAVATGRVKDFGVDASFHQEARFPGASLQQFDQLGIGRVQDLRDVVKAQSRQKAVLANPPASLACHVFGQPAKKAVEALLRVLMQVCVPGCGQWNAKPMRDQSSKDSNLARTGNVHDVGVKFPDCLFHGLEMPAESEIEIVPFVDCERQEAARKRQPSRKKLASPASGHAMDDQERQPAPPRKGFELAARVGDAVYLVVGIGEEGDAQGLAGRIAYHRCTSLTFVEGKAKFPRRRAERFL